MDALRGIAGDCFHCRMTAPDDDPEFLQSHLIISRNPRRSRHLARPKGVEMILALRSRNRCPGLESFEAPRTTIQLMHPIIDASPTSNLLPRRRITRRLREAKVSVLDRGFIFGDGVYEVVPVYGGQPVLLRRAHGPAGPQSLAELQHQQPDEPRRNGAPWSTRLIEAYGDAVEPAAARSQLVYIQVTRGVAPRDHAMPQGLTPTVFAMVNPMKPVARRSRAPRAWPA